MEGPAAPPALVDAPPARRPSLASKDASDRLAAARTTDAGLPSIWEAIAEESDVFVEHFLLIAARRRGNLAAFRAALSDESPRVQRAALLLLDHDGALTPEDAIRRVSSPDPDLRGTALRLVQARADWAAPAIALVAAWLGKETLEPAEFDALAGSILAFQAHPALQDAVGSALAVGQSLRRAALLDAVSRTTLPKFPASWKKGLASALGHDDPALRLQAVRTAATLSLKDLDDRLVGLGSKEDEAPALRLEALRASVTRRPGLTTGAAAFLRAQVAAGDDPLARLAAAEVLRRATLDEEELAAVLVAIRADGLVSPSLFLPAVRAAKGPALAEAAASIRAGWRPPPAELGAALTALPADARELVERAVEEQRAKLERFAPLLTGGNPVRGRAVFEGRSVACGSCHAVGAQGGRVGPDLTKVGAIRAGRDLLESILVPSSTFAQGYEPYLAATIDGDVLSGVIARQTAEAVTLRDSGGRETVLRRDRIRDLRRSATSVMPESLERALNEQEFRDLLAYLQGLK